MSERLYYEEIEPGQSWTSKKRTVTEADIVQFASSTGDFNPLHMDHEFARESTFGQPIAHGLMGLAWVAGLGSHDPDAHTLAFVGVNEWKFLKPLFVGDTVHVRTEVHHAEDSGRRAGRVYWKRSLINQNGQVVQEGIFETLVERRHRLKRAGTTNR